MDHINFSLVDSSFDNLDLNVFSSTKEETDILSSIKEEMDARKDLDVYRRNDAEQNHKESLQAISSAIQEQSSFQQPQSTANCCKSEWNHDHDNYPMGCPRLPLHNQFSPPKERPQDKKTEVHKSEPSEIPFSASRPNSSVDNNNGKSQKLSNNDQRLLEVEPGKNYRRCIWCINFSSHREKKERISFNPNRKRPTPFPSGPEWSRDPISRNVDVRELRGDECLDYFMSVQNRSPNQNSNRISSEKSSSTAMHELPSLSELVESIMNDHKYREFCENEDNWLIDQEYFSDTYGITKIHPLLVDRYGGSLMFLDDRNILFEWCEMTRSMYILGINKMEGFANFLYHPEKRCVIEVDGKLIPDMELERQAKESAKVEFTNLAKA
ncbi:7224_t:CDS:2 [Funneliformis caledonium]|uniref:7224_t:CDS:1 n=1 Tax=Funneliformis caledonium TaxID=1117310 RepID=A0A9N9CW95_9GLOM|nr:7224_t:CDS:2 [Funneliformis caledonium]